METARNTIPPDDPSGMEIAMAAVKPGTGEVLSFGLNRYFMTPLRQPRTIPPRRARTMPSIWRMAVVLVGPSVRPGSRST